MRLLNDVCAFAQGSPGTALADAAGLAVLVLMVAGALG